MLSVSILFAVTAPAEEVGLPPRAALTTALTVEGLLFAALSLSSRFHGPQKGGQRWWSSGAFFGWVITAAIFGASVAAGAGWWATFSPDWPCGWNEWLRAAPLLLGIVVPPLIAALATFAGSRTR